MGKVLITVRDGKRKKRIGVDAIPTCSPLFVVHETCDMSHRPVGNLYTVTHVPTGYAAIHSLPSVRVARLIAGALCGLPIDWNTLTVGKAEKIRDNFIKIVGREFAVWMDALNREGHERFIAACTKRTKRSRQ